MSLFAVFDFVFVKDELNSRIGNRVPSLRLEQPPLQTCQARVAQRASPVLVRFEIEYFVPVAANDRKNTSLQVEYELTGVFVSGRIPKLNIAEDGTTKKSKKKKKSKKAYARHLRRRFSRTSPP